jgi:hypothetical protein
LPRFFCDCCGKTFQADASLYVSGVRLVCGLSCLKTICKGLPRDFIWGSDPRILLGDRRVVSHDFACVSELTGLGYRSDYERAVAEWFHNNQIHVDYEPCTFLVDNRMHYTPDFEICGTEVFFEVKGQWGLGSRRKMELMVTEFPFIRIFLLGSNLYDDFLSSERSA